MAERHALEAAHIEASVKTEAQRGSQHITQHLDKVHPAGQSSAASSPKLGAQHASARAETMAIAARVAAIVEREREIKAVPDGHWLYSHLIAQASDPAALSDFDSDSESDSDSD